MSCRCKLQHNFCVQWPPGLAPGHGPAGCAGDIPAGPGVAAGRTSGPVRHASFPRGCPGPAAPPRWRAGGPPPPLPPARHHPEAASTCRLTAPGLASHHGPLAVPAPIWPLLIPSSPWKNMPRPPAGSAQTCWTGSAHVPGGPAARLITPRRVGHLPAFHRLSSVMLGLVAGEMTDGECPAAADSGRRG
jgi:hypothetical protein